MSQDVVPQGLAQQGVVRGVAEQQLLQSVVEVARQVYSAAATSVFMTDPDTGELIFAAVAGEGEETLIGTRFPAGTGIAGWVAASCQPMIVDDVAESGQFAGDAAASTGFVPSSIMAAPLVAEGECIGVLEVLDRYRAAPPPGRELDDVSMLGLLATQAALALALLRRRAGAPTVPAAGTDALLSRWASRGPTTPVHPLAVTLLQASVSLLESRANGLT
jgi:GAF domain-containing protein